MDLDAEWESFLSNGALNQHNNVFVSINNEDVEVVEDINDNNIKN